MRFVFAVVLAGLLAQGAVAQTGPAGPMPEPVEPAPTLEPLRRAQRSPKLGVAMSIPIPGWGQLYADSPFWGIVAFGAQAWFAGSILLEGQRVDRARTERDRFPEGSDDWLFRDDLVTEHRERRRDFVWWSAAAAFVIALDSYVSVSLADFDDPGVPTPDLDRRWPERQDVGGGVALRLDFGF